MKTTDLLDIRRPSRVNRRAFLGATLGIAAVAPVFARQQTQVPPYEPRDWSGDTPLMYPDPDIIALDDRFRLYILFNTPIRRHYVGTLWGGRTGLERGGDVSWCGATSRIIGSCDGSRMTTA